MLIYLFIYMIKVGLKLVKNVDDFSSNLIG